MTYAFNMPSARVSLHWLLSRKPEIQWWRYVHLSRRLGGHIGFRKEWQGHVVNTFGFYFFALVWGEYATITKGD
jgi:hypothetical protein